MFTDIVGYTALTQENEGKALRLLAEHNTLIRQIIGEYGGREVKTIGDSFLIEFGSVLDAVRCGVEIQEKFHDRNMEVPLGDRIELRVGIHLGDVVGQGGDIFGDAVNVSSRLQALADTGGVCLSEQVYSQIRNKLDNRLLKMGRPVLKGVDASFDVYKVVMSWEEARSSHEPDKYRVAVLPFKNMSQDPNDEYLAEGMTEELITAISSISDLAVIARTSVMPYKSAQKRVSEIGLELNAGTIIEGSVRKASNRIRITVQLIDARNERHLWAQNYDRELQDVFDVETEVAEKVAESLKLKLFENRESKAANRHVPSVQAHEKYLLARYNIARLRFGDAARLLEESIRADPEFPLAYSELANLYVTGAGSNFPPKEAASKASEYASKALALDDTLAEAWVARGNLALQLEWDLSASESSFKRAISLNPSCATAYTWYGTMLLLERRFEEAIQALKKAVELDPADLLARLSLGGAYSSVGLHHDAIRQLEFSKALGLEESELHNFLALFYAGMGMTVEARSELDLLDKSIAANRMAGREGWAPGTVNWIYSSHAFTYAANGEKHKVVAMITDAEEAQKKGYYISPAIFGTMYLALGDYEKAFEQFEKGVEGGDPDLIFCSLLYPDTVRSDPRFMSLLAKMGFHQATSSGGHPAGSGV